MSAGKDTASRNLSLLRLAVSEGTPKAALLTALIVGSALVLINHYDLLLAGRLPSAPKLILTYLVPYCVATWGAITAKQARRRADAEVGLDSCNPRKSR